CARWQSGYDYW
nr:immunoglobulin heavy chain junction region [Macaca mulatta]MOV38540.1 immunoglobulin heavy chain junction region [Macaca mulatta]MOV39279.1 immunoglobulin heavy chain junction region [Macaca mulatta]MOV39833.1 immunoglobulin heavy chain junction region [Macaca mulatta]MOV39926.1 immunoglobulin heavy chain junction region [Macaca mulatta]